MFIRTHDGIEEYNQALPEGVSVTDKLTELLGVQTGLLENLNTDDFKNPWLGQLVCPTLLELSLKQGA